MISRLGQITAIVLLSFTAIVGFQNCSTDPVVIDEDDLSSQDGNSAPRFSKQPTDIYSYSGNSIIVSLTVEGQVDNYVWYRDNMAIASQTGDRLIIDSAVVGDTGVYHVVISNSAGEATSSSFKISVVDAVIDVAPEIQQQPEEAKGLNEGETLELSVTASGSPTPTYQWYKNGTAIAGATSPMLVIENMEPNDTPDNYYVIATNTAGEVQSTNARVRVQARQELLRYFHSGVPDHDVSSRGAGGLGYTYESSLGWLLTIPRTGTQPLYECKVGPTDHMISKNENCEGFTLLRQAGYIWQENNSEGTRQAIYRCRIGFDHFVSKHENCEGQIYEALLGYTEL